MKNTRIKKCILVFALLLSLTNCRAHNPFEETSGEWQYKDVIYLKCAENQSSPIGWVKLDNVVYNYIATFNPYGFSFHYEEGAMDFKYDYFWEASLHVQFSGNIKLTMIVDYTKTYSKDTNLILKKMES